MGAVGVDLGGFGVGEVPGLWMRILGPRWEEEVAQAEEGHPKISKKTLKTVIGLPMFFRRSWDGQCGVMIDIDGANLNLGEAPF